MFKISRRTGIIIAVAIAFVFFIIIPSLRQPYVDSTTYYQIVSFFQSHQVREFTLDLNNGRLMITRMDRGELTEPLYYTVPYITQFIEDITPYILEYNENNPGSIINGTYIPQTTSWWMTILPFLMPVGMIVFLVIMMRRQTREGGNMMSFGKAKMQQPEEGRRVAFSDVAGADEEKEELVEIVEFLKNPEKFVTLGARIPKGVILMGPPGTGKTLLARAVAGEAGVQFFSMSGSDFVEMFVGVGASRVRDLFEKAKKNAPSVIFIDEIDAVGRQRGAGLGGGHDEREQTLNQLLVEMDGFSTNTGVIVMAATNRRDILDPALMRPGRFDRQIVVNYPDIKGREEILKVHARNKTIDAGVNFKTIAGTTAGFTGADLENLLNEAALLAARNNKRAITMEEVEEATIKVLAGPEKRSHVYTEKDRKLTAYHEAGHAICTYFCPTQDPIHQVSIIPRGMAGGYTMSLPGEDRRYRSKSHMFEDIVVLMGGRVAEQLALDDISTGASNDLERASKMAHDMVTRYGFSSKLGPVVYKQDPEQVFLGRDYTSGNAVSESVASEIDAEVRALINNAYSKATDILTAHLVRLHFIASQLLLTEKIDGVQFTGLMQTDPIPGAG